MFSRFNECDGYFSTTDGSISSPSYPNKYPINTDCIYAISQPVGTVILLDFLSMDTEFDTRVCRRGICDYLEIKDGPSEDSTPLAKLCGSDIPDPINSTQNHLWMR